MASLSTLSIALASKQKEQLPHSAAILSTGYPHPVESREKPGNPGGRTREQLWNEKRKSHGLTRG